MALRPIKLRLGDEDLHLVDAGDLARWGGRLNGPRAARVLVGPQNMQALRRALLVTPGASPDEVLAELRRQLEDGAALFFEVPPAPVAWDAPEAIDIHDLSPIGGDESVEPERPSPQPGLHWVEVVCVSADGAAYPGAKARVRLPDGRSPYVTLDGRSCVRFDDLTAEGTVHFELSGDAVAKGSGEPPVGQRYPLGSSLGLPTGRRHVLVVHPNPNAFVSVQLFVGETAVQTGRYALKTAGGEDTGDIEGPPVRAEGFALPSTAAYGFEGVTLPPPPRPADERSHDGSGDRVPREDRDHAGDHHDDQARRDADAVVLELVFEAGAAARGVRVEPVSAPSATREADSAGRVRWDSPAPGAEALRVHVLVPPEAFPTPDDYNDEAAASIGGPPPSGS